MQPLCPPVERLQALCTPVKQPASPSNLLDLTGRSLAVYAFLTGADCMPGIVCSIADRLPQVPVWQSECNVSSACDASFCRFMYLMVQSCHGGKLGLRRCD